MQKSPFNRRLGVATLVLAVQAVLFYSASHGEATPLAAPLAAFPHNVGDFHLLQEGVVDAETLEILKADDTLTRLYQAPGGAIANLFVAYFKTQRTGQSPHSPKNCLPGSGWQQEESGRVDVDTPKGRIHINRYVVSKGENKSLVMYWYQSQGRVIADEFEARFRLIEDSIRNHRSDTSLVRVVVPVGSRTDKADATAQAFVQAVYPAIKAYLPQ